MCHVALHFQIKTKDRAKKKKNNDSGLYTFPVGLMVRHRNNAFSVPASCAPYWLFVLLNQARVRYSLQRKGSEVHWIPQQRFGECWVCKSTTYLLSTFLFHVATADCISVNVINIFLSCTWAQVEQGRSRIVSVTEPLSVIDAGHGLPDETDLDSHRENKSLRCCTEDTGTHMCR